MAYDVGNNIYGPLYIRRAGVVQIFNSMKRLQILFAISLCFCVTAICDRLIAAPPPENSAAIDKSSKTKMDLDTATREIIWRILLVEARIPGILLGLGTHHSREHHIRNLLPRSDRLDSLEIFSDGPTKMKETPKSIAEVPIRAVLKGCGSFLHCV